MTTCVLLTGATGFVGRQVLKALNEHGTKVRVVIRDGTQERLPATDNIDDIIATPDLFAEGADWWARACNHTSTVIHTAWYAVHGQYLQSPKNLDCLIGTLNLAKGASRVGVKRFVGVGTCSEYDVSHGTISTDTPLKPTTPYAATKAAAFTALSAWCAQESMEFAWCRLFYLYGEAEDSRRLAPYLRSQLAVGASAQLTSGKQIRDFLDVRDSGRMIAKASLGKQQGPLNVCSGVPTSVKAFAEKIADEFGRRDLLKFGTRPDNAFDPDRVVGIPSEGLL